MNYLLELGAEGQDARLRLYEEELKKLDAHPAVATGDLSLDVAKAEASLSAALAARRAADEALKSLSPNMPGESPLARRLASLN
jgi:hypothetical protein